MPHQITRLQADDAARIVACFRRVYGDSYANELFYDSEALASGLKNGRIGSVGALAEDGSLHGHMAMTVTAGASVVELGNTVVDPVARGGGLAWKIGAELSTWCRELGYQGFLHYPTTDHHIMQRQSVQAGFEVGLMLGYIPGETHGQVGNPENDGRQAATIVYEPYASGASFAGYLPAEYDELLHGLANRVGLPRTWHAGEGSAEASGLAETVSFAKRGLDRYLVTRIGLEFEAELASFAGRRAPCLHIDLPLTDPAVDWAVSLAREAGFGFCGWLPGYRDGDVLRLQRVDPAQTDLTPALENSDAKALLALFQAETQGQS